MEDNHAEWLPHLSGDIVAEAHGNYLDAYVVALEGWRRGLALKWHVRESERFPEMRTWFVDQPGQLFTLSSEKRTHYFFRTRGDKVSNEAVDISKDKGKTKKLLQSKNIRMPEGEKFSGDVSSKIISKYAGDLGFPVVIKPVDGSFGKGVVSDIQDHEELEAALEYVRHKLNFSEVIVEKYIPGEEYRIYIVDGQVVGAMNRIPANITGDGKTTIRTLIGDKNTVRASNPRLVSCPILVNEEVENFLSKQGLTLDSIPETGEKIFLTDKTNISIGGDPIDVFDELPEEVKAAARDALQAVPQLSHGAVDLIIHEDTSTPFIIELNPTANLGGLLYPIEGKARDIPSAIIDHYFPETADRKQETSKVYFDYKEVLAPLADKTAYRSMVVPFKYDILHSRKYELDGEGENFDFHQWIKTEALECDLIGHTHVKEDGGLEIIIAGAEETGLDRLEQSLMDEKESLNFTKMSREEYDGTIKIGFEIQGERKELLNRYKKGQSTLTAADKELKRLEKQYANMLNSRAWKLTRPLRKITGSVKSVYHTVKNPKNNNG